MKNRNTDLNDHLFAEIEKLSDEDLVGDELKMECLRASAIAQIGTVIVKNHKNAIDVMKLMCNQDDVEVPDFLVEKKTSHPVLVAK